VRELPTHSFLQSPLARLETNRAVLMVDPPSRSWKHPSPQERGTAKPALNRLKGPLDSGDLDRILFLKAVGGKRRVE
jgi:hypothetical protein